MRLILLSTTCLLALVSTSECAWSLQVGATSQRPVASRASSMLVPWQPPIPATPLFAATQDFELSGSQIMDLETGDFDNDGHLDVATSAREGEVSILYGDGTGQLPDKEDFWAIQSAGDPGPWGLGASDFNGDGILDFAVTVGGSYSWSGQPMRKANVYLGDNNRHYSYASTVNTHALFAIDAAGGDFNGDTHSDLVVVASDGFDVFMGNGDGTFGPGTALQGSNPDNGLRVKVADMDADGNLDVIAGFFGSGPSHRVYWGDGSGIFDSLRGSFASPASGFAIGDFNGDGMLDTFGLVKSRFPNYTGGLWVAQTISSQNMMLGPRIQPAFVNPGDAVAGDFNGDGFMDTIAQEGSGLRFFLGNAAGGLTEVPGALPSQVSGLLVSGDWNEDGKPDLAIAWEDPGETPEVRLFLNVSP